ncbi:MAG: DUF2807 domain-containing protein [Dehalococcoidia bacterium]|jgi:hypothetical protein
MAKRNNLSGYSHVKVRTAIDAEIVRSDSFSIDVETGPLSPVSIRKKGEALTFSRPWYWFLVGFFFQLSRARAKIGMPSLHELVINDNSSTSVAGFSSSDEFKLTLSRASVFSGDLKTGDAMIEVSDSSQAEFNGTCKHILLKVRGTSALSGVIDAAGDADIVLSDNSVIKLSGSAGNTTATINHGSTADLSGFQTHDVSIKMYRLSRCMIKLDGRLDAMLNGASDLRYFGTPAMGNTSVSTGSILRQE